MLSFLINSRAEGLIRQETMLSIENKLSFYLNSIETEIEKTASIQKMYSQDDDFLMFSILSSAMNDRERVQRILNIKDKLNILKESNPYLSESKMFLMENAKTISSQTFYGDFTVNDAKTVTFSSGHDGVEYLGGEMYIRQYPLNNQNKTPIFMIESQLSRQTLLSRINEFKIYSGDNNFLLYAYGQEWNVSNFSDQNLKKKSMELAMRCVNEKQNTSLINAPHHDYILINKYSIKYKIGLCILVEKGEIFGVANIIKILSLVFLIVSIFIITAFSGLIYKTIQKPLIAIVQATEEFAVNHNELKLPEKSKDEFGYLYSRFQDMFAKINTLMKEVYEQKYLTQRAELKQLQSQINPHFLYNIFFTIFSMAELKEYKNITRFTKSVGKYFEFIAHNVNEDVRLELEMEHTVNYIEIQKIRFYNRINIEYESVPEAYTDLMVPKLLLQPLVENCYTHGLKHVSKNGWIRLRFLQEYGGLRIVIEDSGSPNGSNNLQNIRRILSDKNLSETKNSGIINTNQRLKLKFGHYAGITADENVNGGIIITITIPTQGGVNND